VTDRPTQLGTLDWQPALQRTDLVADPVAAALRSWAPADQVLAAAIDPDVADTAAFTETYRVPAEASANCVVVAGRRGGDERVAACVVLATTRADVNGAVRRRLDVRKASFLGTDDAVARSAMEYGGITPIGLPEGWPVLVDEAVGQAGTVVIGSGLRRSKLALPGDLLAELPGAEVVAGLAR
jgi:prolyl-tRNA editing enzyme YbaK/EbsC (Cys-tRNA(Pro) deacylase)